MEPEKKSWNADIDFAMLDKELSKAKTAVFRHPSNAAFLGSLMSMVDFRWTSDIETACTTGRSIRWNPYFFLKCTPGMRVTILVHELWHIAFLDCVQWHAFPDHKLVNIAMDIRINNQMAKDGIRDWGWFTPCLDRSYDGWLWQDIYADLERQRGTINFEDILTSLGWNNPEQGAEGVSSGGGDLLTDPEEPVDPLSNGGLVMQANQMAKRAGEQIPGEITTTLKRFLEPKLPWEQLIRQWLTDMLEVKYSYARPCRRFSDVYLPDRADDEGRLKHVVCFQDVSGSVGQAESIRFNSELKHLKEEFNPKKITVYLFDTDIRKEFVLTEEDFFDEIEIIGGGGTCLVCVRDKIIEQQPDAVIVFSDMYVTPMEPLPGGMETQMLWVAVNADPNAKVPHGRIIHIKD